MYIIQIEKNNLWDNLNERRYQTTEEAMNRIYKNLEKQKVNHRLVNCLTGEILIKGKE